MALICGINRLGPVIINGGIMKVLFLLQFPMFGNGSGAYTRRLATSLVRDNGFEVAIASPDNRRVPGVKIYDIKFPTKAVFVGNPEWQRAKQYSRLSPKSFTRIYTSVEKQIVDIVDEFKPDVIHVNHAFFLTWIASYIKSFYGIGFVTTIHGTGVYVCTQDIRYRALTKQALERSEQIIAVGPHAKKWMSKVFGRHLIRKTKIIPGGIEAGQYKKLDDTRSIDKKYNLEGKKLIIFVGRLTPEKGLIYLLKAAKKIDAEILIIGDGPEKKNLQNQAKQLGVGNVRFLGYFGKEYVKELKQLYSRADALVLPSVVDEALPLVILEAMASETPVIASNKGGIPLVVKDGKNGFLIRAKSSKTIADAVNLILKNPKKSREMGIKARQTIVEKFDYDVITPKVIESYRKVFESTKRMRDKILAKQEDKFKKQDIERERKEMHQRIGYIS